MNPLLLKIIGAGALVIAVLVCWIGWTNAAHDRDAAEAEVAELEGKVAQLEAEALITEVVSLERADDVEQSRTEGEELEDARTVPTDTADDRELRALCVRRRQAGATDNAVHPVCSRFAGASGTDGS